MFGLFNNPEREAKQLNKDAEAILDSVVKGSPAVVARAVAEQTRAAIDEGHEKGRNTPELYQPLLDHYRTMNVDARRNHNQLAMSAFSLTMIYLRAEMLGSKTVPAREAIDEFLASWAHIDDDFAKQD